jgi:hypothetical protein
VREILEYLVSTIVSGTLFVSLLGFYVGIGDAESTQTFSSAVQQDLVSATGVIESDMQKIGYGSTDTAKVTLADTASVTFKSDIDADGTVDTVRYYIGGSTPGTLNAQSQILYRKINTQPAAPVAGGVSGFRIWYFNSAGSVTSVLSQIRSIRVRLTVQSSLGIDGTYPAVCWDRIIRPRNLR